MTTSAPTLAVLTVKTTIAELQPGDVFAYTQRPGLGHRSSPVATVEHVGGQPVATDAAHLYPEAMYRVRHEDSDALGTLYYGTEVVWRAKR